MSEPIVMTKEQIAEDKKAKKKELNKQYYENNKAYFQARDRSKTKAGDALTRCKTLVDSLTELESKELVEYIQDKKKRDVEKLLGNLTAEQRAMLKGML
jgi:hypothetical protein